MKKISRKKFLLENPDFPQTNYRTDEYTYPKSYDNYKLTLSSRATKGHATNLSVEFPKLMKQLGVEKLRFLGDTNIPWLYRLGSHDYPQVKSALNYLVENRISKSFNGAIELAMVELPVFIKNLFWLVRCNGVINYVHFGDEMHNMMMSICKYGNIHISILNNDTDLIFNEVINNSKFELIEGDCYESFSKSGAITGRIATSVRN